MIGATLFSGGRGVEALLTDAIDFRLAVEYDPQIAAVGAQLGGDTIVSKVEDVDYSTWPALDYLHASPVCKEYSQAKVGGAEGESDLSSAAAVVRCLEATRPRVFTLENVGAYQHGQAYRSICQWLNHNGYMWHAEVLNSADFAVPQTRRRLILRAVRDALLPPLPAPEAWVGWYAAIEDLIPTLPESAFAPWQEERLPAEIKTMLIAQGKFDENLVTAGCLDPPFTITANSNQAHLRAFIVGGQYQTPNTTALRIVQNRKHDEPIWTIVANENGHTRAWLIESKNANQQYGDGARREDEPATTVVTDHKPSHQPKAWLSRGKVVRMTPRALARFQSLPDWYVLPTKASLACTVIGNMWPSLMAKKMVLPLLG